MAEFNDEGKPPLWWLVWLWQNDQQAAEEILEVLGYWERRCLVLREGMNKEKLRYDLRDTARRVGMTVPQVQEISKRARNKINTAMVWRLIHECARKVIADRTVKRLKRMSNKLT